MGCACACARITCAMWFGLTWALLGLWLLRATTYEHLDDVYPGTPCTKMENIASGSFLWIVPIPNGEPIDKDPQWCAEMKKLEREGRVVLGMHGVTHEKHANGQ